MAESELQVKGGQLEAVKTTLEEEVAVRQAYQQSESVLDGVALGLKKVVHHCRSRIQRFSACISRSLNESLTESLPIMTVPIGVSFLSAVIRKRVLRVLEAMTSSRPLASTLSDPQYQ